MTTVNVEYGNQDIQIQVGENTALAMASATAAAVSAAVAEAVVGPNYANTTAGLAATTSGQSFAVNNGDGTVSIYRNVSGSAVLQRSLGTTAYNDIRFSQKTDLAATTGAALIGANDASSGAKYTTVQGFLTYLLSSAGSTIVGFIQNATGAVYRTLLGKLRDTVSPEDFGAVALEDGASTTASQSTPFRLALESGRLVDCNGKTYVMGGTCDPVDNTVKGLINGNFIRAPANHTSQNSMFNLSNQANVKVRNCSFDFGSTENAGSNNDSSRQLLVVGSANTNPATWLRGIEVTGCRFTGSGNGTPLFARGTIGAILANNTIVDRIVDGTATNDAQNGIDYSYSRGAIVTGNFIDGLYYRVSGNLVRQYSRGIVAVETSNAVVSNNIIRNVDQGIDFSGGISASLPDGNYGISCVGNSVSDVRTWGIKFANCIRDSVCSGNTVRNFGWGGIVVSGQSSAGTWGDKSTRNLLITGNYVFDPADYFGRTDCIGIWIIQRVQGDGVTPEFASSFVSGVRIIGNTVANTTGNGRLLHGMSQDDGDGAHNIVTTAPYNEVSGNKVNGQTGAPTKGVFPDGVCALTGSNSQSIPNAAFTAVNWDVETVDGEGMHSNVTNPERITVVRAGWYEISFSLYFAANATGNRQARILVGGGTIPGGEYSCVAITGVEVGFAGRAIAYINAGVNVRIETFQNSGGALNLLRPNSQFSVRRIEQM
jgi:hypothetical protein